MLNDRKESLTKSEAELEKVKARRERMIAMQDRPAASESRKARSAEKAELEKLRALLAEKGVTAEELLAKL